MVYRSGQENDKITLMNIDQLDRKVLLYCVSHSYNVAQDVSQPV